MTTAPSETEKQIWDLLMEKIENPYGVAGIMGNLYAESSMRTTCMTGGKASEFTSKEYVDSINYGLYGKDSFSHDGIAFGLVQWLFWSRKEALYDYAKGKDISVVDVQIGYLLEELPKYKSAWTAVLAAKNVEEASDIIMTKYEKPADQGEKARNARRIFSQHYYDIFYEDKPKEKIVVTNIDRLLVRYGNGKEYGAIGRIEKSGSVYPWVATSENGWHAIIFGKKVGWVSGDLARVEEK